MNTQSWRSCDEKCLCGTSESQRTHSTGSHQATETLLCSKDKLNKVDKTPALTELTLLWDRWTNTQIKNCRQ